MLKKYEYRRTLPHYQGDDKPLFVTFTTHRRWYLPPKARDEVLIACLHLDGMKRELHACVVMPDHAHLLFTPMSDTEGPISIPEIMQKLKSESAHGVNAALQRKGRVWQSESFDHVLRREEVIDAKVSYILENPVRAGLVRDAADYRWSWHEGLLKKQG